MTARRPALWNNLKATLIEHILLMDAFLQKKLSKNLSIRAQNESTAGAFK